MRFRFTAFGLHLAASASVLALVISGLYLGWYRWPGWYAADALRVAVVMVGADVGLGPLLTLLIANPRKPRHVLARDIAVIAVVQLVALIYGTTALWHGRPLFYTFSEDRLEMVAASDVDADEISLARRLNPAFAPVWYSRPRWIWAPLPDDETTRDKIVTAAIAGGNDVIQMPRYFKTWEQGLPALRKQLKPVDKLGEFGSREKQRLKERMVQRGFTPDQPITMPLMGRGKPILAVIDPATAQIRAFLSAQ